MGDTSPLARYSAAIERAYSDAAKPADNQADFDRWYPQFAKAEYDTAAQIVSRVKDAQLLNDLRDVYLRLYAKYAANRLNVHFARSDQAFLDLFERCQKLSTRKRDLLGEWAALLDDKKDNPLQTRFRELSKTYQTKVRSLIPKPPAPVKTILALLRDEFLKQRGYAPRSNADLYDFDPSPSPALSAGLQGSLDSVYTAWKACLAGNEDTPRNVLHGTLDGYREYLQAVTRQGLMQLFQVIKYLQDRIFVRRENMGTWTKISGGDTSPVTCELYAMACLQLLRHAQGELVLPSNRDTFTREEQQYLLRPLGEPKSEYSYFSNIEDRLRRPLGGVAAAFDLSKTFLDLLLWTRVQIAGATLVPLGETLRIQALWQPYLDLGEKLRRAGAAEVFGLAADPQNRRLAASMADLLAIEVPLGEHDLDIAYARVGASPGVHQMFGRVTIVHIDARNPNDFYVEYEALKPNLFLVHKDYIITKVYGSRIFEVHKSTVGMNYLVPGMFVMMGFLPAFIESGFAGLIYEIATWYVSSKIGEQVEEIDPRLGKIVGFALQIAAPRSARFGTKVVEPPSVTRFEPPRIEVFEAKGIPAEQARGVRQADSGWLDRNLSDVSESQRAVGREPVSAKPAPAPAEPEPAVAKPVPAQPGRGEPTRPQWQHQGLQQQQTRVKAPEPPASGAKPTGPPRPRQQGGQPVGQRTQPPEPLAPKTTIADATAENATSRKGTGDRGVGERPQGGRGINVAEGTVDLSRPGAISQLANARPEELVAVLEDKRLFNVFKQSLRTSEAGAARAARDIAELGRVVGRFTNRSDQGVVHLDPAVAGAVWRLPEHLRGVLIEHALANTQYSGWFRAGQLDRGFFPQIDYAVQKGGLQMQASLKTVNPFAKGYETQLSETLPHHLEEIVTAVENGRAGGFRVSVVLDVRLPRGSAVPRAQLQKTLDALIPSHVKRFVTVKVEEF
jgi:hypothetical protein